MRSRRSVQLGGLPAHAHCFAPLQAHNPLLTLTLAPPCTPTSPSSCLVSCPAMQTEDFKLRMVTSVWNVADLLSCAPPLLEALLRASGTSFRWAVAWMVEGMACAGGGARVGQHLFYFLMFPFTDLLMD